MSNTLLVSTRKGLAIYAKRNGVWKFDSLHFRGIPICLTHFDAPRNQLWAFQDHGHWGVKVQRSGDFGASWEEVTAPRYPEGSEVKDGMPASLSYIWAAHSNSDGLWLGTVPGGLFSTTDNGASFTLNNALWNDPQRKTKWMGGGMDHPGIHSIVADPEDDKHLFIAISCAGVYETTDGGKSWMVRNKGLRADFLPDPQADVGHDPHLLVACKSDLRHMWQQNHCGIFRSIDGARSWTDVSDEDGPAGFGFAIAVAENNPDVAWVVPAVSDETRVAIDEALCVCRTDDGGRTWQAYRKGLPQEGCFDIVYRHGLVNDGDNLVFGTTTGNLFESRDGGESWGVLSNYLPLINAVTLADH